MNLESCQATFQQTLFILVLYRTSLEDSKSFITLTKSVETLGLQVDLLIYDNSPEATYPDILQKPNWVIHYIHDKSNPGVSKAYNKGFHLGKQLGKKWLLLLDQDTEFQPDALMKYHEAVASYQNSVLFAPLLVAKTADGENFLLSPCRYRFRRGFALKNVQAMSPGEHSLQHMSLLNSGIFIDLAKFETIGGYDERIKLDFSDFKFINKYKKLRRDFILVETKCLHGFSNIEDDLEKSLSRFCYYCDGARNFAENIPDNIILFFVVFMRCLVLTVRFKSYRFIRIFGKFFLGDTV
jgi:rhamnosyltransferase